MASLNGLDPATWPEFAALRVGKERDQREGRGGWRGMERETEGWRERERERRVERERWRVTQKRERERERERDRSE